MSDKKAKDELKSEATSSRPRDEKGRLMSTPKEEGKNVWEKFLISHTGNYKNEDDILDIHVGNPFHRIIKLLEDIKKQKAFSFTFKGSLGIAGVIVVLSVFGLFGGNKIVCDKGVQTQIGTIRVLDAKEIYQRKVPIVSYLLDLIAPPVKEIKNRIVLIRGNEEVVYLPFIEGVELSTYDNKKVFVTGNYDICTNTLAIKESNAIEYFVTELIPTP